MGEQSAERAATSVLRSRQEQMNWLETAGGLGLWVAVGGGVQGDRGGASGETNAVSIVGRVER